MLYLGIAGGAALGGVALRYAPSTQLGWMGAIGLLLALLLLFLGMRVSVSTTAAQKEPGAEREAEKVRTLP